MTNIESEPIFSSYGYEIAFLFQVGGYYLEKLYQEKNQVNFTEWKNIINKKFKKKLALKQLIWLWKAIVTEPKVQELFSKERLISYSQELKLNDIRFPVLPSGEQIAIFLKNHLNEKSPIADINSISEEPNGLILLKNTLDMQPGEEGFFKCCDVDAELTFKVSQPESTEQESKFLQLDAERIEIEGNIIKIKIDSLNHAYKLIDRRLSQEKGINKKTHGGSIYIGNLAWVNKSKYISLGKIKLNVEEEEWQFPENGETQALENEGTQISLDLF